MKKGKITLDKIQGYIRIKAIPIKPEPRSETLKKIKKALGS